MMYIYYYIKTDCVSNTWDTSEIRKYLHSFDMLTEKTDGIFSSRKPFLDISLIKAKDPNSWSNRDYDSAETNYISIITDQSGDNDAAVAAFLKEFELFLGFRICRDNC